MEKVLPSVHVSLLSRERGWKFSGRLQILDCLHCLLLVNLQLLGSDSRHIRLLRATLDVCSLGVGIRQVILALVVDILQVGVLQIGVL